MLVQRVLFEGTRAVGVQASQLGQVQELRAEREVILCGGAYNSPQLLMLSGVGPAEHLTMREIEVLLDQPAVGENLSDHPATQLVWTTPEPQSLLLRARARRARRSTKPRRPARSPRTSPRPAASPASRPTRPRPTSSSTSSPVHIVDEGMSDPEAHGVWVSPCLLTAHSRGSVRLASNDPTAKPIVHNAFYTAGDDMQRMIAGLRLTLDICAQPAMRAVLRRAVQHRPPGDSDEDAARARRAHDVLRSTTPSAPAGWARTPAPSSTRSCASTASRACAWSTRR